MLTLFFSSVLPGVCAETYQTGELIRIESVQSSKAKIFELYIREGDHTYAVRLNEKPSYQLEWQLNQPIEFRIHKNVIYLKRPSGKEYKITFVEPSKTATDVPHDTPDLPFPPAQSNPNSSGVRGSNLGPLMPLCARIAGLGTQYSGLANACQFASSARNLPNYICEETMQRSRRRFKDQEWKKLNVVTAQVTSIKGQRDQYSNLEVNGYPFHFVSGQSPGFWSFGQFGGELSTIFDPATLSQFMFRGNVDLPTGPAEKYSFQFHSGNNLVFPLTAGRERYYPGLSGTIWVDRSSGNLVRVEAFATDLNPKFPMTSYFSAANYSYVPIPGLGQFLLPIDSEVEVCNRGDKICSRNLVSFHSCRKFQATVKILPDVGGTQ
ncbi:MAG TPA: hypothetical protein VME86_10935 [Acidobacteriaceae bacterium]|nr:hypothetical protein [Acidobacteriaceae bacterium]